MEEQNKRLLCVLVMLIIILSILYICTHVFTTWSCICYILVRFCSLSFRLGFLLRSPVSNSFSYIFLFCFTNQIMPYHMICILRIFISLKISRDKNHHYFRMMWCKNETNNLILNYLHKRMPFKPELLICVH